MWKEKFRQRNISWRSVSGIGEDKRTDLENAADSGGPGAVAALKKTILDLDPAQFADIVYLAMCYLILYQWEGDVQTEDILAFFEELTRSDEPKLYLRREDAMNALVRLHVGDRNWGFSQTDPRATEVLINIACDDTRAADVRRDAVKVLASEYAIGRLHESEVAKVFKTLMAALIASPVRHGVETELDSGMIVQGIRHIAKIPWREKTDALIHLLEQSQAVMRGGLDGATVIEALAPLEGGDPRFWNALSSFLVQASTAKDERMTGLLAELLIASTGGDPMRAGHEINAYERSQNMPHGTSVRSKREQIQLVIIHCLIRSVGLRQERSLKRHLFEYCHRKDLKQCVERCLQAQPLPDDRDQHVDRHRDPDLRLHGVLRGPVESLDAQVLLDPLEEQLHLPAALVESTDRQRRQRRLVGEEDQPLACLGIPEADPSQVLWVVAPRDVSVQRDGLIAD